MGILAKYMSSEKFSNNLINDCLLFVQHVLANDDDADKRSAVLVVSIFSDLRLIKK